MRDKIRDFLAERRITNFHQAIKQGLQTQPTGNSLTSKVKSLSGRSTITTMNTALGIHLLNEQKTGEGEFWRHDRLIVYGSERYHKIVELLGEKEWEDPANYALLIYFFGEEKAPVVRHAWKKIRFQMYQTGYYRRSFRSPHNRELYLCNQINFIAQLIPQSYSYNVEYNPYRIIHEYYNLSIAEQMRYTHATGDSNPSLFMLWAAAIDMDETALLTIAEEIFYDRDEEGKVTRSLIKSLLNTDSINAWKLVEQLLLAAQRQEGLRQTILETLDETSIGALRYMIKVIINHNLARFSSVVRAVDVWMGMGWETERENTVRLFLDKADHYLEHPGEIPDAISSASNADVYMALWAQGVQDIEGTIPYLNSLYSKGNEEKRALALLFSSNTDHYKVNMPLAYQALEDKDMAPLTCALNFISIALQVGNNNVYYNQHYPNLFQTLNHLLKRITIKEKTYESYIFSWLKIKFEKKNILLSMLRLILNDQDRLETVLTHYAEMDVNTRRFLSQQILPVHSAYSYHAGHDTVTSLTAFQRSYAMLILKDRSEHPIAFKALHDVTFTKEEASVFPELLKRKAADYRNSVISLLLKQPDELVIPAADELLSRGDAEQRIAGLDILLQLRKNKRLPQEITRWAGLFRERKNISQKEEILLLQLEEKKANTDISAGNGYGLFNPANTATAARPVIDSESLYEKLYAKHPFAFSMPTGRIKEAFHDLAALLDKYKNYEYEIEDWDGSRITVLLGNRFRNKNQRKEFTTQRERYEDYPLPEIWEDWYKKWNFEPIDLLILRLSIPHYTGKQNEYKIIQIPDQSVFMPVAYLQKHLHEHPMNTIIYALRLLYPYEAADEFLMGATTRLFAELPAEVLNKLDKDNYYSGPSYRGWQQNQHLHIFLQEINISTLQYHLVKQCWDIYNWRQYSGTQENIESSIPPLLLFCRAFEQGIIGEDDMYRGILTATNIDTLSRKKRHITEIDYYTRFPFLEPMFLKVTNHLLDTELKRGDSDTPVTHLTAGLKALYGISRFFQILVGLGKTPLHRGYLYSFGNSGKNKQELFSALLKYVHPLPTDSQEIFNKELEKIKISDTRLVEAAVYAPQWQRFISGYLGWEGLDSAIWWMHAHTKTSSYNTESTEAESEIAKYSSIDLDDFKQGAVDKDWFMLAYKTIGKEKWPLVYDAAKYISDGNGHRRARIYADVLLGILGEKVVAEKIKAKRDQDYVRIYGLLPLSPKNREKDLLSRYEYLNQFSKESRQFGAQKQSSEAIAIRIAMENLARNAGYPDPLRLTWAMETKQVQAIFAKETQIQYEDTLIGLIIDEEGQAEVVAFRENQQLKAIPPKYKKDVKVEELLQHRKTLREQFRRSKKALEEAMVRGDEFHLHEIVALFSHPVIVRHLEKLVFITSDNSKHGFYQDGHLINASGLMYKLFTKDSLRIAHCADLYHSGDWQEYQRISFEKKLQQPFKQIFRELYLLTPDELKEQTISRRYSGHQVQPGKTAALLRSRGWKADYEEGLQKVFHQQGFTAKLYAMADWYSPAEAESPTLETIEFHDLKTGKNVPFASVNPRTFSEVMRDIDLVVSIAHVGKVDAEASHSSIEMRSAMLRETLKLFKLTNVEISGNHVLIKGKLAEYSIHIGSAVVHQVAAGYMSILPVHSQHRGRLFLPFVDDDPKSAEVISKVLLLARDHEIKDPNILSQLRQ